MLSQNLSKLSLHQVHFQTILSKNSTLIVSWIGSFFSETNPGWRLSSMSGTVVQWLSLLHSFIQQSLNSGSAHVQIFSRRVRVSRWWGSLTWFRLDIRLNPFPQWAIPQEHFIIIIIIIIIIGFFKSSLLPIHARISSSIIDSMTL